ncbi:MAG: hypothetical protein AAFY72_10935 [Cyanobacteria bacterium J06649_4]
MDAIEQQRRQLIDDIQTLPADVLQKISDLVTDFRQKKSVSEANGDSKQETKSAYEALKEAGLVGFVKDGAPDSSTNYKESITEYLEEKHGYC